MRRVAFLALTILVFVPVQARAQTETIEYYGLDHLGSVRIIFNQSGQVADRMDYGPFGENLKAAIKFAVQQFAQLARDGESGQDYAEARNYAASSGRFNRVDPVYAGLFHPQRWNRYAYALNSPLVFADKSGLLASAGTPGMSPAFCEAAFSYGSCGGDDLFWNTDIAGGGGFGFGGDYARAQQRGYVPGMPNDVWLALEQFNQQVNAAFSQAAAQSRNTSTSRLQPPRATVSTSTEVTLPDGTKVQVNSATATDIFAEVGRLAGPMADPTSYLWILGGSAVGGGLTAMGPVANNLLLRPAVIGNATQIHDAIQGLVPTLPPATAWGYITYFWNEIYTLMCRDRNC